MTAIILEPPVIPKEYRPDTGYDSIFFFGGHKIPITLYGDLEICLISVNLPPETKDKAGFEKELRLIPDYANAKIVYSSLKVLEENG